MYKIYNENNIDVLARLEDNSIDTLLTDPPYGLSFMNKKWDYDVPSVEFWEQCLRVLKPGATALIFAGSRTQHRMAVNVEDAGFEIFDTILWIYGQGFPKSHSIEKALLKKCTCGTMEAYEETKQNTKYNLRQMPESNIPPTVNPEDEQGEILQSELSEQGSHETMQGEESEESELWRKERILERGNNLEKTKGELQGSNISEMPQKISSNGEERRVYNATSASNGDISEQVTKQDRSSPSRRSQSKQQQNRESCPFCQQYGSQEIRKWSGWGTALKPSYEPIICARKKVDGTYANNALEWGVSGLWIDGGRIETEENLNGGRYSDNAQGNNGNSYGDGINKKSQNDYIQPVGRYPANIILDEEAGRMLDEQSGNRSSGGAIKEHKRDKSNINFAEHHQEWSGFNDKGGASRFFYCAKASKAERNLGLEELSNIHPTVKPLSLMRYLARISRTPTGGTILDPFMGSATTILAALLEDRNSIGIELDQTYFKIAQMRINHTIKAIKEEAKKPKQLDILQELK